MTSLLRRAGAQIAKILTSAGDPGAVAGQVQVYSKLASGIAQLFAQADDGTVTQLTPTAGTQANEMWAPPIVAHAGDDEFNTGVLSGKWSMTGFGAALDFVNRPNPYATALTHRASFENRRSRDVSAQTTWLRIQPGDTTGSGIAGIWKSIATADFGGSVPTNLLAWGRFTFAWRNAAAPSAGDANIGLTFFNEAGAGFSLASEASIMLSVGPTFGVAGVLKPLMHCRNDTAGTSAVLTEGDRQNVATTNRFDYAFYSGYVGIQKIATTYYGWLMDDGGHLYMGQALPIGGGGVGPDNANAIAIWCQVAGTSTPGTMFYDIDFVRFVQFADWLP